LVPKNLKRNVIVSSFFESVAFLREYFIQVRNKRFSAIAKTKKIVFHRLVFGEGYKRMEASKSNLVVQTYSRTQENEEYKQKCFPLAMKLGMLETIMWGGIPPWPPYTKRI
jgi:hypothetical protein